MKNEIWKDIKDYEGLYQISDFGNVKSLDKKVWNGRIYYNKNGKLKEKHRREDNCILVTIYKNNVGQSKLVHRLVGDAFIPNPENKPQINHIDGHRENNHVSNLEWATSSENMQHAHNTGLIKVAKGSKSLIRKPVLQKDLNGIIIKRWECIREASRELGIKHSSIINVCSGREKTLKKQIWCYA